MCHLVAKACVVGAFFLDALDALGDAVERAGGAKMFGENLFLRNDVGEGVVPHVDAENFGDNESVKGCDGVGDDCRHSCKGELERDRAGGGNSERGGFHQIRAHGDFAALGK